MSLTRWCLCFIAIVLIPKLTLADEIKIELNGHIRMVKVASGNYKFEICDVVTNCEVVGHQAGYRYAELESFSGRWQKWGLASSVLVLGSVTVGGSAAFFVLSPFGWSAAALSGIGGLAGGASLPMLLPKHVGYVRQFNPRYHWHAGSMKSLVESTADLMEQDSEVSTVILFESANTDEGMKTLEDEGRILYSILRKLD